LIFPDTTQKILPVHKMEGCRSLETDEIERLKDYFESETDMDYKYKRRDYALIFFSCYVGFRISETLSLKVADIINPATRPPQLLDFVYLKKANTKRKVAGRTAYLNNALKPILQEYLDMEGMLIRYKYNPNIALFPSPREENVSLTTRQAERIFKRAFAKAEITGGKLATHVGRKTFAKMCYDKLGNDILSLQTAMGHKNLSSTQHYIKPNLDKVKEVLKNLVL
jgi:site-specific recombinase XerD